MTGSTAGIGYAIAAALAREGATVVVNGRTAERVNRALAALKKEAPGSQVEGLAADLGSASGTEEAARRFPDLDILINNLGIFEPKPFETIPDEDCSVSSKSTS